jgi:hypothetical protein
MGNVPGGGGLHLVGDEPVEVLHNPAAVTDAMLAGGRGGLSPLSQSAPGTLGAADTGPPFPTDSNPDPYPTGTPARAEEEPAPHRQPGAVGVRDVPEQGQGWSRTSAGPDGFHTWLPHPSGQAG